MTNIGMLTSRLDELLAENHRLQETTDEANRIAKHHTKENQRLKTELSDLARQVRKLKLHIFIHSISVYDTILL